MKAIKLAVIGIITGLLNGFFGSGGGTVLVPAMQKFLKTEAHKSHATAIAVILPLSAASAAVYINDMELDVKTVLFIAAGGVAGGFLGAKLLNKIKAAMLHKIFGICMAAAGLRMIF